jgi:hypothetical protein
MGFESYLGNLGFFEPSSEKGCSRKTTGKRVARWGLMFLEEFGGFTLFYEENQNWGNFTFVVFGFLGVGPRRSFVEGANIVVSGECLCWMGVGRCCAFYIGLPKVAAH